MVLIIFFLLFVFTELDAVLEKARLITDSKRAIMLFSDNHDDYPLDDARQCSDFLRTLLLREQKKMSHLHVLIEQPIDVPRFAYVRKVTTDLLADSSQYQFHKIDFEDIEIRRNALLAATILNHENPEVFKNKPVFDSVSFVDILNEFVYHVRLIQSNRTLLRKHVGYSQLNVFFASLFQDQDSFVQMLHYFQINPSLPILSIAQSFYEKKEIMTADGHLKSYDDVRRTMFGRIIDLSIRLLNLHLLHKIVTLPDDNDIALIVGGRHAEFLNQALTGSERSRYAHILSESSCADDSSWSRGVGLSERQIFRIILGAKD